MKIGYACITLGVPGVGMQTCRLKNASDRNIRSIIENNLNALKKQIEYNAESNIMLFRISSDIIPFASHPEVSYRWCEAFRDRLHEIGEVIRKSGMRVSMHPGQYTVLNSINEDVVDRAAADLKYHTHLLDCLEMDAQSKVILHVGGVYGDKNAAVDRFIENYKKLDNAIKNRLIIENDDKHYNIEDVLNISEQLEIPVVFDNLHHEINPPSKFKTQTEWIKEAGKTWSERDGQQKIHYSQQDRSKRAGAHSRTTAIDEFKQFLNELPKYDLDIMLEVKDKNLSAVKCLLTLDESKQIKHLEKEWAKYKYYVLGKDPKAYLEIRELLKDKKAYPADEFYKIVEDAINAQSMIKNEINAAQHVFGYFKREASFIEKRRILGSIEKYKNGKTKLENLKKSLYKLAEKYDNEYLLNSYYFIEI
ncbi:MAG: UV DNA damage repair endonuclease UvsE [Eubacteriales bacterium]